MLEVRPACPRVSVVVPVLNEGPGLAACLDALVVQSVPSGEFEVIVVDGGSADGTAERVMARGFRLAQDPGGSVSTARNLGVALARSELVAFTDGDCVPARDWLERLLARADAEGPDVAGVGGALRFGDAGSRLSRCEDWRSRAFYRGFITSNVAYRRDVLLAVGGFNPMLRCGEDWDVWWRVTDAGWNVVFAPEAVVEHVPAELDAWHRYVRRQFWYARNDVRTFAMRAQVILGDASSADDARRVRDLVRIAGPALAPAAAWAALAGVLVAPRRALALAGLLLGGAVASRAITVKRRVPGASVRELVAYFAARLAARGLGSLVGVSDWARHGGARVTPGRIEVPGVRASAPVGAATVDGGFVVSGEPVPS